MMLMHVPYFCVIMRFVYINEVVSGECVCFGSAEFEELGYF